MFSNRNRQGTLSEHKRLFNIKYSNENIYLLLWNFKINSGCHLQLKFWKRIGWASMKQLRIHLWHYLPLLPPKSSPGSENLPQSFHSTSFLPLIPSGTPVIIAGQKHCLRVRGLCRFRGLRVWSRDQNLTRAFVQLKGPCPVSIPDEVVKMTPDSAKISAQEEF